MEMRTDIHEDKLNELLGTVVMEMGAAVIGSHVAIGDALGLYKAFASGETLTSDELAERTDTHERYIREWLAGQAASGYVNYDADHEAFFMTPEQIAVFADEDSPVYMVGGYIGLEAVYHDLSTMVDAFRTGQGVGWGEHCNCLFTGTEKFFKPTYRSKLVPEWLPALDGVIEKLERGAKVADVGCGHGASTIIMGEAFPNSQFFGFDIHDPSIARARQLKEEAGLDNVHFEVATSKNYNGLHAFQHEEMSDNRYDLATFFDCLHDMGDPVGAASHARRMLKDDGTMMVVEPLAHDDLEDNLNPVGRVYYAYSAIVCVPCSLSQEKGMALGAQAGEKRLSEAIMAGGFSTVRRAAETPFNMVLEAKP